MTTTPAKPGATAARDQLVTAADADLLAEHYDEAAAKYREAIAAHGDVDGLAHKLQRAEAAVESQLTRGEQQAPIFHERLSEVAQGELLEPPPALPTPPPSVPPLTGVGHRVKVVVGRGIGSAGSAVFHTLTRLAGRRGVSDGTWTDWYSVGKRLPGPLRKWYQILKLGHMRETLFENNLVRPYPEGAKTGYYEGVSEPPEWARRWRSADGSWNNLIKDEDGRYDPMVGAAYTRFFRNVGDDRGLAAIKPAEHPATQPVSVRELSRRLMTAKGERQTIPFLNLWAGAWIQFQNADWVSHGGNTTGPRDQIPLAEDDPLRSYGIDHLDIFRTDPDPTRRPDDEAAGLPPTFLNEVTHWWDGSQIYGSDWDTQRKIRSMQGGKLRTNDDGTLPVDPETGTELTGFSRNWWVGLGLLHTVFVREHNAICDRLAEAYPEWDDEALFQTARLVNAAVMAKIHTIEWTPAILPNHSLNDGMMSNWYGLVTNAFGGRHKRLLEDIPITSRELGGIVGNPQGTFAKYGLSEEFTAVYRLHSLLPDVVHLVHLDGTPAADLPLARTRHAGSPTLISEHGIEAWARTFGEQEPGALVNNNYPAAMQDFSVPGLGVVDMGSVDLYRDRERGVPTFNQLRREIGLEPIKSFDEMIDDKDVVADLRDVYGVDEQGRDKVDDMDLLIGTLTEAHRPTAFGFGETLFQIFILNASWRLLGDRFYTDDYRAEVYTEEGLAWVDEATFKSVLLRNIPALASTGLANIANAFEPWDEGRLTEERHPLRGCTKGLGPDPWAGDAASAGA
jgi:Animal haem peroxidase